MPLNIPYHQFINQNGQATQALPEFAKNPTELIALYRDMQLLRTFDAKAVALHRTGKLGTFPSSLGQEALMVGLGRAMHAEDVLCPYYRDHGVLFQRGVSMAEILTYWNGDERGNNFSKNKQDFPIAIPIASQCLHAAGVAYAFKLRKKPFVAVATCGDGGTSKGDFYEALNIAGIWQLPLVFVVNNNQWAISTPRKAQTKTPTLAQKAVAAGFPGIQVDGNDIIAVQETATQAIENARKGLGPCLIEALTYRLGDHTTADDARRYYNEQENSLAWKAEPVTRLQIYLKFIKSWSDEQEKDLLQACQNLVAQAAQDYLNKPKQKPESMVDYLYETLPESLEPARKELQKSGFLTEQEKSSPFMSSD